MKRSAFNPPIKNVKLNKARWIAAAVLAAAGLGAVIASRLSVNFADWFGFNIYPYFSGIGSRLNGLLPFSVAEFVVMGAILGFVAGTFCLVKYVKRRKGHRVKAFFNGFSWYGLIASALFLLLSFNCLTGYNRTPFSQYSGLTLTKYTAEELKGLTLTLIEGANKAVKEVPLDSDGRPLKPENFNALACEAMEGLGEKYEVLKGYYPQPKAVLCSEVMSSLNLAGIYFPITVEANYNQAMPVSSQGFTACHELSHLTGFIREDEANYIAYAACRESADPYFRYSGYLSALTYALNAYYAEADRQEYYEVIGLIDPVILAEYSFRSDYWAPFQKKVTYKVSSAVNDVYLKANNQTDGTKSYGRIVDLMIAEWLAENE